jgi:N-acetylglucosaminyl-diphospho-decaprenol L-rhamnosyltransferase
MTPELSVVLVNHNGADCLPAALDALTRHTIARAEWIVVDSASTDGSWRDLERRWPGTRVLRHEANIGFAAGCNRGAEAARAPLVAFVNFDGAVEPGWDAPLRTLLEDPGVALATGLLVTPDGATLEAAGLGIAPNTATYGHRGGLPRAAAPARPVDVAAASGALMMVRREEFRALGGFYERLWMYGEEADYAFRLPEDGRVVVHPGSAIRHELGHASGSHQSAVRLYWSSRNRLINAARHLPLGALVLAVAASAAFDLLTLAQVRRPGTLRLLAGAWRDGGRLMATVRRERSAGERTRSVRRLTTLREAVAEQRRLGRLRLAPRA